MIVSDENRIKSYDYRTTVVNDFYDNRSIDIDIEEDIEIDKDISNYNNKENPSISEVEMLANAIGCNVKNLVSE